MALEVKPDTLPLPGERPATERGREVVDILVPLFKNS